MFQKDNFFRKIFRNDSLFFIILFATCGMLFSPIQGSELEEPVLQEIPTCFKGRFRPLDAMARLWLEEFYHRQSIKPAQFNDFHVASSSALSLLWRMQFTGHQNWIDIPIFWVYSAHLKELLDLPLEDNYFSFRQLHQAIYERKKTNLAVIKELITYSFLKAYYDESNRSGSEKLELQQLSPGLWTVLQKNQILISATPTHSPWQYLRPGFIVSDHTQDLSENYVKKHRALNEEIFNLLQNIHQFSLLRGPYAASEKEYINTYHEMIKRRASPQQISDLLNREYPLDQRLGQAGPIFKVLPAKNGEWYSLNALTLHVYNIKNNTLEPIKNFTVYPDQVFEKLQTLYFKLIDDSTNEDYKQELATLLISNYPLIHGQPIQKAWEKSIYYPSTERLKIEYWYYQLPLVETTIVFYGIAIILFIVGLNRKKWHFGKAATFFMLVAFAFNTLILIIRCLILGRPPVSNMFETVIYVPWIAVLTSLLLTFRKKNFLINLGACLVSLALLILLKVTGLGGGLENVQAVLDSQYWLIIHVLMVVGSYGVFALAGVLGQFYLFQYLIHEHETYPMQELGKSILQAMYLGVTLLIPGTILGGVWAAQSWGRFWDWDPKESWAFISSCVYLIFIHAYTFKYIKYFGLAMGSVLGLLAISFTWYGVNYILGTGLHSYGFGSGGEIYYYLFILAELLFLMFVGFFHLKTIKVKSFEQK